MKLHLLSDLHVEFGDYDAPLPPADVLLLAGDITSAGYMMTQTRVMLRTAAVLNRIGEAYPKVLWVPGNHESYGHQMENTVETLREFVGTKIVRKKSKFFISDMGTKTIGDVAFIMATLWTDYDHDPVIMEECGNYLNDHRGAIYLHRHRFSPSDALQIHEGHLSFIKGKVAKARPKHRKVVVMTHHAPSLRSIHPRYAGDIINGAFCSDLEKHMEGVDLWVHGHVHDQFDYVVDSTGTRVVANPRGYPGEKTHDTSSLVIDL